MSFARTGFFPRQVTARKLPEGETSQKPRRFALFGLEKYGALVAILMQMIPSTIVRIGKPASESFAAIVAGLVFGYLAVRTCSILYPLILHAAVGIGTDVFVALRLWGP